MKRLTLDPIVHKDFHTEDLERELLSYLADVIYDPLREILKAGAVRQNEKEHSALWDALMLGVIWYADGMFTGSFSAAISRELRAIGARRRGAGFALPAENVPLPLRAAIAASTKRSQDVHAEILLFLAGALEHVGSAPTGVPFTKTVDILVEDLQEQFARSVLPKDKSPFVSQLPPGVKDRMREVLEGRTERSLRHLSEETIRTLIARVRENLASGARTDRLGKIVESEFGVSQRRARGIAESGAAAVIASFRETRYREIGVAEYIWTTSHDEKVRPDHALLDGHAFSWDNPPIANRATGDRYHPGCGPNCRCHPRPVVVVP